MPRKASTPLGKEATKKPARPGHGGPRKNAGRPPGPAVQRSKKIADEIAEGIRFVEETEGPLPQDATPLDVMLMAMRKAYLTGGSLAAAPYAEKCAPYIHARIAQMELKPPTGSGKIVFKWEGD